MGWLLSHSQTKGAATDRLNLRPPRHILILTKVAVRLLQADVRLQHQAVVQGECLHRQLLAATAGRGSSQPSSDL